ncbi:MAG: 3-dehydroquinate synthase II family protein [Desulfovibrionaceae bacterium]|nr:3-dehydroquinate synthase II family protein [Desulfovibrionaceae bacterium]MBR5734014.1 3-dehydroquinate synthase II family protein [Desulfovibrionaceae bacterium]
MRRILFKCVPFEKNLLTLALESGVDGVIVPEEHAELAGTLSRVPVIEESAMLFAELSSKDDERMVSGLLHGGGQVCLSRGWEIIPVENLLAENADVALEVASLDEARLAAGILEKGVSTLVVPSEGVASLKAIVAECKLSQGQEPLVRATITRVEEAGLGHRVCVDTLSLMATGQGMLVGDSSAFTFLVHAETERNEYVASRPFRINAGAVHAYVRLPDDKTCYLGELCAGRRVLIVDAGGQTTLATVGRVKTEVRPMLLVEAQAEGRVGTVFLQNAETIRLVTPEGKPVSVVTLKPGDEVLCRLDEAGRHFGMRVSEDIREH